MDGYLSRMAVDSRRQSLQFYREQRGPEQRRLWNDYGLESWSDV